MEFKHMNIDEILNRHKNETLAPHTIEKITEEYEEKYQMWLNEERF